MAPKKKHSNSAIAELIGKIRAHIRAGERVQATITLAAQDEDGSDPIGAFTIQELQEIGHFKSRVNIAGIHLEGVSSERAPQ